MSVSIDLLDEVELDILSQLAGFGFRSNFDLSRNTGYGVLLINRATRSLKSHGLIAKDHRLKDDWILTRAGENFVLKEKLV